MAVTHTDYTGLILDERYRVVRRLAMGGMGSVYLGQHITVGRKVAIKFLHEELIEREEIVIRFFREAQAAAAIQHKNIIDVWDVGHSPSAEPYLVMEYLEGESLSDLLKRSGPIDLPAACAVLEPALQALGAAHDKGIIHRDLKPDNIFLAELPGESQSVVKLIDFGVSKFTLSGQTKMTVAGTQFGTPAYMAPEQIRGVEDIDHRADLYSVGVVLYKMLTGKLPFQGANNLAVFASALTEPPVPPEEAYKGFPAEAGPVIMQLLNKTAEERPASAADVLAMLETLPGYGERHAHLAMITSGVSEKSFAGGDLGGSYSAFSRQGTTPNNAQTPSARFTPNNWVSSVTPESSGVSNVSTSSARKRGAIAGLFVLLAALVASGIYWLGFHEPQPTPITAVTPAPAPAPTPRPAPTPALSSPKSVEIVVKGVPAKATLVYDGAIMPRTRFRVNATSVSTKLEVKAPGYERQTRWVTPDRDRTIELTLEPIEKAAEVEPALEPKTEAPDRKNESTSQETQSALRKVESASRKRESTSRKSSRASNERKDNTKTHASDGKEATADTKTIEKVNTQFDD